MRLAAKFWGSMTLFILGEVAYTMAFLNYVVWDTHIYYILGVCIFALWLLYATSLVVKGPLFAAPGILAICLALLTYFIRYDLVTWQASIVFIVIAIAYFTIVIRSYRSQSA